ncbi:MAG: S1 RNA-binding domain-containing protein [Vicinamibacterales bacterium]
MSPRVKNITDYGALIDLGGIDGLLHITMSQGPRRPPVGSAQGQRQHRGHRPQHDQATERSRSATSSWCQIRGPAVMDRYPAGARVSGKAVSLTDYGAFVELEPGVEGLIHVSEMSWSKRVKHLPPRSSTWVTRSRRWCSASTRGAPDPLGLKQVESNSW